ncbi:MAG: hypothetical protein AABY84_13025 [Candidatus Firestonebacteria bacterium]
MENKRFGYFRGTVWEKCFQKLNENSDKIEIIKKFISICLENKISVDFRDQRNYKKGWGNDIPYNSVIHCYYNGNRILYLNITRVKQKIAFKKVNDKFQVESEPTGELNNTNINEIIKKKKSKVDGYNKNNELSRQFKYMQKPDDNIVWIDHQIIFHRKDRDAQSDKCGRFDAVYYNNKKNEFVLVEFKNKENKKDNPVVQVDSYLKAIDILLKEHFIKELCKIASIKNKFKILKISDDILKKMNRSNKLNAEVIKLEN